MLKNLFTRAKDEPPVSVLVVSDDAEVLSLLNDILTTNGYMVHLGANTDAAVQLLDEITLPDVFIGDFVHPGTDGKAFLERVRMRFGKSAQPPVVFLMDTLEDEATAQAMGVNDLLPKPFETETLLLCIKTLVDRTPTLKE